MQAITDPIEPGGTSRAMRVVGWVSLGGVVAGLLDIAYAVALVLERGRSPIRMLQSIASGIFGKSAYAGGYSTAVAGLLCHLLIAQGMAWTYWYFSARSEWVRRQLLLGAFVFGIVSWLVMQYVVVPLSAAPFTLGNDAPSILRSLFSHIVLVGLPLAWTSRQAWRVTSCAGTQREQQT